jgi:hypothetical protein
MKRLGMFAMCIGLFAAVAEGAAIQLDFGPVYPPPGGNSFAGSGNGPGRAGGFNFIFSNIDLSKEQALYWGMSNADLFGNPVTGLSMQSGSTILNSEVFGISGDAQLSANAWQWSGKSTIIPKGLPPQPINTRVTVTVSAGTGAWIQDPTTLGLDSTFAKPRALWNIKSSSFTANVLMEAQSPLDTSWQPYNDLADTLRNAGWADQVSTDGSFTGGFYGTVPEPYSLAMIATGAVCLLVYARRSWKQKP